jgi:hypothetical protein
MPRSKKPSRKHPLRRCDELFSKIVRARGACEECGHNYYPELQCAHGIGRSYKTVRWDERNAFCLCKAHHVFYTFRPVEWDEWLRSQWGDELYLEMRGLALLHAKPDYAVLLPRLQDRWAEIQKQAA